METEALVPVLNALGVPLLASGLVILYQAIMRRLRFLEGSLKDVREAYNSALEASKQAADAARQTAQEKESLIGAYRNLVSDVLSTTQGSSETSKIVVANLSQQIEVLEGRASELNQRLQRFQRECDRLREENTRLNMTNKQQQRKLQAVAQVKAW